MHEFSRLGQDFQLSAPSPVADQQLAGVKNCMLGEVILHFLLWVLGGWMAGDVEPCLPGVLRVSGMFWVGWGVVAVGRAHTAETEPQVHAAPSADGAWGGERASKTGRGGWAPAWNRLAGEGFAKNQSECGVGWGTSPEF